MSLLYIDGFDSYITADITKKWTSMVGATISAGNGRRSTASMRPGSAQDLVQTLPAHATWIVGCAVRFATLPGATATLLEWRDESTVQNRLSLNADGTVAVRRGTTTILGTSTAVVSASTWHYLEWLLFINNTTGTSEVRLNGILILTLTPQDTQATANAFANSLVITAPSVTTDLDDLYICDGAGSAPHNTFLGDCRVDTLLPSADGTSQQWTPSTPGTHYTLVDETAPNTTDYVSSSTAGHRDTYGMQDLTAATGTIYGVQLSLAALKSDAGARSIKPLLRSGASEALGTATALSTSQTYTRHVQTTDPATAAAWTEAGVNAAQCGAETA